MKRAAGVMLFLLLGALVSWGCSGLGSESELPMPPGTYL